VVQSGPNERGGSEEREPNQVEVLLTLLPIVVWPLAVVVLVIAGLFILRAPITRFIDRAKSAGFGSTKIEADSQAQAQQKVGEALPAGSTSTLDKIFANPLISQIEQSIFDDPTFKAETDPNQRQRILLRYLASSRISFAFERIYRVIFGSQIKALKYLAGVPAAKKADLEGLYADAVAAYPAMQKGTSVDGWLQFLQNTGLVHSGGDVVQITLLGREFLKHLIDMRYPEERAG
jgi:hypothetical protein